MKIFVTLLALATFATPATALAQEDGQPACSEGYVLVQSVGGPLCVNPIYLEDRWDDPTLCEHGYYQGSCAPAPAEPVVFTPEAYAYQTIPAVPAAPVAVVVERVERVVYADPVCLVQRPC